MYAYADEIVSSQAMPTLSTIIPNNRENSLLHNDILLSVPCLIVSETIFPMLCSYRTLYLELYQIKSLIIWTLQPMLLDITKHIESITVAIYCICHIQNKRVHPVVFNVPKSGKVVSLFFFQSKTYNHGTHMCVLQ